MFFRDILRLLVNIANGVLSLTKPFLDFLNNSATIGGITYSYFELLVGGGLIVVITWGIVKWVIGL